MKQEIEVAQQIYELIINFLVTYSFQIAGAIVILIAGFIVGGWVSRIVLRMQERRNVDVPLRQFIASVARLAVIGLFLIIAVSKLGISITPLIAAIRASRSARVLLYSVPYPITERGSSS